MKNIESETHNCTEHGAFEAYRFDFGERRWTGCPACAEIQRVAEAKTREVHAQEQARQERIAKTLRGAVPCRYASASLSDISDARIATWARAVAAGDSAGPLVLTGPVGTGKTHAALAVLRHVVEQRACAAHYVVASEFTRRMRATWSRDSREQEADVLQRHARGLLVLDDLGAGAVTPELQDLVAMRYADEMMSATVVCTNIAAAAFDEAFGQRIADRLRHGASLIVVGGKSRRSPSHKFATTN